MKRRSRQSFSDRKREQVYRDWLGTDLPLDPQRNISSAGEKIDALMASLGLEEGIDQQHLQESWAEIAGEFIAMHTAPDSLKKGHLKLKVLQPAMRHHLEQSKTLLLQQLQVSLGEDKVKRLDFILG